MNDLQKELKVFLTQSIPPHLPTLSDSQVEQVLAFYDFMLRENALQNLTRLSSPSDFFNGHVLDVLELLSFIQGDDFYPAVDLGSGAGVPGLLAAIIQSENEAEENEKTLKWVLVDSEISKAEYLMRGVELFGLQGTVHVYAGRGEEYLKHNTVSSIVARAVGKIVRIYSWFEQCSTWNKIVLFKGPGWDEEWSHFLLSRHRKRLTLESEVQYTVGPEQKKRRIVKLDRHHGMSILK
jgi:16S rRNA G527 N7-methylase RsmG